jgi:protein SCO1/2
MLPILLLIVRSVWLSTIPRVHAAPPVTAHQHGAAHTHGAQAELPAAAFSPDSLYQLTSVWTTASGQSIHLSALRGKPQVMVMAYTSCEYACPIFISIMQNNETPRSKLRGIRRKRRLSATQQAAGNRTLQGIERALAPALRQQVGFVAVSFDPEHDTPAVLQAYGDKMHLDPAHWTLLHGAPEDVLELAVLLGVKYKKDPQGGFAHANLITVLNQDGEIVYRHTGLQHSVADTIAAIHSVAQDNSQENRRN